jgi:diguanylate cyclase (GGDEF)-like protein
MCRRQSLSPQIPFPETMDTKTVEATTLDRLGWLVERLLALLSSMAAAGNSETTAKFRFDLNAYRKELLDLKPCESFDTAARKCLALCQDYFEQEDSFRLNHASEYSAIIDALRGALASLVEDESVEGMLIGSPFRFRELVAIEDIHQLKVRIEQEVQILEQTFRARAAARRKTVEILTKNVQLLGQKLSGTRRVLNETQVENSLDPLTTLSNRRHLDQQLERRIRAARDGSRFVLAMLDIDDFKRINDEYGHQAGDHVLCSLAKTIRTFVCTDDVIARYGGDEFALLLQNTPFDKAVERCQKLVEAVRAIDFRAIDDGMLPRVKISVSCGLTDFVPGDSPDDLLQRADKALYLAKKRGKNRVEIRRGAS